MKIKFIMEVGKKSPTQCFELILEADEGITDSEVKECCLTWLARNVELWMYPETGKKIPVTISEVRFAPKETATVAENSTVATEGGIEND